MPPIRTEKSPNNEKEQYSSDHTRIPRPSNAFMLFRSQFYANIKGKNIETDHRVISRMAAYVWNLIPDEAKSYWRDLAITRGEEHAKTHPDYRYSHSPRTKLSRKKKVVQDDQTHIDKCHQLAESMEAQSFETPSAPVAIDSSSSPTETESDSTSAPCSSPRSSVPSSSKDASPALRFSSPPSPKVKHELESPHISFDSLPATSSSSKLDDSFVSPLPVDSTMVEENYESEYPDVDDMDELVYPDEFVATEDIPPLDLPAPMVTVTLPSPAIDKEEKPEPIPQTPTPALPFDREIDNQFGCKFQIYNLEGPARMTFVAPNAYVEGSSSVVDHHHHHHHCYTCSPHVRYPSQALPHVVLNSPPMSGPSSVYTSSHRVDYDQVILGPGGVLEHRPFTGSVMIVEGRPERMGTN